MEETKKVTRHVTDLGAAAYIVMHGFSVVGKKGQAVYFQMEENEISEFDRLEFEYLLSEFHRFDSCLMSLKKLRTYEPGEG